MKPYLKYLITIVVLALAITVFYQKVYVPKTTYETLRPTVGSLQVSIRGIGNVGALNIYSITAQTGGKILEILADDGSWVKKGDLLVVMDGVDLLEQLEVAKANLSKSEFDFEAIKSELDNQKAQKELLQATYNRYKKLKGQGFVSLSEYDKVASELKSASANVNTSLARINASKSAMQAASKNIDAIKAKSHRLKVYSPVDGYVISRYAQVAQNVLASTPILKVVDPKTLWVQTKIDERISSQINVNQIATISLRSQPEKVYTGVVKRIASMSDSVTLEREINVAFDSIPKPFFINEQAEVKIVVRNYKEVVKIPSRVVVIRNGALGVWLVEDSQAKFIQIQKIAQSDSEIAISNINPSARIIVPNSKKKSLEDGMKIRL